MQIYLLALWMVILELLPWLMWAVAIGAAWWPMPPALAINNEHTSKKNIRLRGLQRTIHSDPRALVSQLPLETPR